jgi:WXG100 family type VII secretion target
MSIFQFMFGGVSDAISQVTSQSQAVSGVQDMIKGFVPKVQGAWIGGDADEFASDVNRRLIPKIQAFIQAFSGINSNLTKSTETVQSADQQLSKLGNQIGDEFSKIF